MRWSRRAADGQEGFKAVERVIVVVQLMNGQLHEDLILMFKGKNALAALGSRSRGRLQAVTVKANWLIPIETY